MQTRGRGRGRGRGMGRRRSLGPGARACASKALGWCMPCSAPGTDSRDPARRGGGDEGGRAGPGRLLRGRAGGGAGRLANPRRAGAAGGQEAPQCAAVPGRRRSGRTLPGGPRRWGVFQGATTGIPWWSSLSLDLLPSFLADWQREKESCFSLILILNPGGGFGINLFGIHSFSVARSERPRAGGKFSWESFDAEVLQIS